LKSALLILLFIAASAVFAQQPYWWDNPHGDDTEFMYEPGMAADAPNEQEAVRRAVLAAKEMLVERIGIVPALREAGLSSAPEFALVNCTVSDKGTERKGKNWSAWVMVKYPQAEKETILQRWKTSIASIMDLKEQEKKVPMQFSIGLATADGRLHYREGETVSFTVSPERDCHLVLLDHMSDGTTVLLFPNRYHPDSYVRKCETLYIPPLMNDTFSIVVGSPWGDDRVEAIGATDRNSLHSMLSSLVAKLDSGSDMAVLSRSRFVEALDSAMSETAGSRIAWGRAEINLSTYSK